jgi:hypothetical protein
VASWDIVISHLTPPRFFPIFKEEDILEMMYELNKIGMGITYETYTKHMLFWNSLHIDKSNKKQDLLKNGKI